MSENETYKDRLTGEEYTTLFSISFMRHGSPHKEMKTQRNRPEYFHAGLMRVDSCEEDGRSDSVR